MAVLADVDARVAASLRRAGMADRGLKLVVGVSGGADSSTLLYSLNRLRSSCNIDLHVSHLNHDFRGEEADEDARFVQAVAHELGLPVTVEKRDPIAYQRERQISSFEQGAREMRYEFMARVANQVGAPAVAVGHTSDDLAETVLLHIMRGAGLHGIRGMTETAPWPWPTGLDAPVLLRPLLDVSKAETVEYCSELGRPYRQDSGNLMFRFTRNRVRRQLMPLLAEEYNPRVRDALVRLSHTASLDLAYMEGELERVWPELLTPGIEATEIASGFNIVTLRRQAFNGLHLALRRLALRRAYVVVKGDSRRLLENHLLAMTELTSSDRTTGTLNLPGGIFLRLSDTEVSLEKGEKFIECPLPELEGTFQLPLQSIANSNGRHSVGEWHVTLEMLKLADLQNLRPPDDFTAYFDPIALGLDLIIRKRARGDRFQPLGMHSFKRLQNYFIDSKVPREWRDRVPLLVGERGIAWVVGYRIADWAKVQEKKPGNTEVLRVNFTQIEE